MSANAAFLEAALPASCRLLGQQLRPYSIGHHLLLQRHSSPFVCSDTEWTVDAFRFHLPFAVFICSHTYEDAAEKIEDVDFDSKVWRPWLRNLCRERVFKWLPFTRVNAAKFDELLPEKCREFSEYYKRSDVGPNVSRQESKGKGKKVGAPYWLSVLCALTSNGWTASEAFNCPIGLANWIYAAVWERDGDLQIAGGEDEASMQAIRDHAEANGLKLMKVRLN